MSKGVYRALVRAGSGLTRASAYKGSFAFGEIEENVSSGVHVATWVGKEWMMTECEGLAFTSQLEKPPDPAIELVGSKDKWLVRTFSGQSVHVPTKLIFEEAQDNLLVKVLMIPSVYDVRYRTTLVRMVCLIGKGEDGSSVLIGLDKRKFKGVSELEMVNLKTLWYEEKHPMPKTSPGWSSTQAPSRKNVLEMNEKELWEEWFKVDQRNPDEVFEDEFDSMDDRTEAIYQRLIKLPTPIFQTHDGKEEESSTTEHDPPKGDFIEQLKPFKPEKVSLSEEKEETQEENSIVKYQKLDGSEYKEKDLKEDRKIWIVDMTVKSVVGHFGKGEKNPFVMMGKGRGED
jgi:hypothetical protein